VVEIGDPLIKFFNYLYFTPVKVTAKKKKNCKKKKKKKKKTAKTQTKMMVRLQREKYKMVGYG